ncbi:MAG TPA: hypothetical protein VLL49_06945 [Anaerolineales bacterium]|nr:hypothetical protein [Anaerolineales bacterium]
MIQIKVNAGQGAERRVHELCDALRHARVWSIADRRCTRNLQLKHSSGTVQGSIRRIQSKDPEVLAFDCRAKDEAQEAITAGRFVNLVLRDLPAVSDISLHRR